MLPLHEKCNLPSTLLNKVIYYGLNSIIRNEIQVKSLCLMRHNVIKMFIAVEVQFHTVLNLALAVCDGTVSCFGRFTPGKVNPIDTEQVSGPQNRSGLGSKEENVYHYRELNPDLPVSDLATVLTDMSDIKVSRLLKI